MGLFLASGTRRTLTTVAKSTEADPNIVLGEDLYRSVPYSSSDTSPLGGSLMEVWHKAGTVIRQSELTAQFPAGTVSSVSPASGPAAGGTTVTINGTHLDGATAVTFGGVAATSVTVISPTQITCVTAAKVAGAADVVVTTDAGTVTVTGGYTYV